MGLSFGFFPPDRPSGAVAWVETRGDDGDELGFDGFAGRAADSKRPTLTAFFERESYPRGATVGLVVTDSAPAVSVRIFRAGTDDRATAGNDVMLGSPLLANPWRRLAD